MMEQDGGIHTPIEPAASVPRSESSKRHFDPVVLLLLGVAILYATLFIDRGWIPHDDGMLGQTALRVILGELPHRDFGDVYTGGLAYWNALSFVLFGINLVAPRILLLLSFVGFLSASYAVARRFAAPRGAADPPPTAVPLRVLVQGSLAAAPKLDPLRVQVSKPLRAWGEGYAGPILGRRGTL